MWKRFGKVPILPLCAAGFLFGIVLCFWKKDCGVLLSRETLVNIKNMTMDREGYLYYVGKLRLGSVIVLLLSGTTYLAPMVCGLTALWFGGAFGVFLTTALMKYGIKGILLIPAGCFPHFLIYIPAFYMLLRWCEDLYGSIYLKREFTGWTGVARLLLILLAVLAGILLESFLGPGIFQGILKIF